MTKKKKANSHIIWKLNFKTSTKKKKLTSTLLIKENSG